MNNEIFEYNGYGIPVVLVNLTGGGVDDWDQISKYHVEMYRRYSPLNKEDTVLEIGCGVGRDAIQLSKILNTRGKYVGIDIIKDSIDWASSNITKRHKNFRFNYYDIGSQIHNGGGKLKTTNIKLPMKNESVDRIFLHSVFTHMFERDIVHYMKEFKRVLKPDGLVLASFFVIDKLSLEKVRSTNGGKKHRHPLSFNYSRSPGCYINDNNYPEGAVGYAPYRIKKMLVRSGLGIHDGFIHRGSWSGIPGASNGQDILILRKMSSASILAQVSDNLKFTLR